MVLVLRRGNCELIGLVDLFLAVCTDLIRQIEVLEKLGFESRRKSINFNIVIDSFFLFASFFLFLYAFSLLLKFGGEGYIGFTLGFCGLD